jgi:Domain of Unknown Function (DUF748)
MEVKNIKTGKRSKTRKVIIWVFAILLAVVGGGGFYLYHNYSRLLSEALLKSFNSTLLSDVYELRFEKLSVNLVTGNIQVKKVELKPRENPLVVYTYINSSFRLRTEKLLLLNVDISTLIQSNMLKLDKIEIVEPEIDLKLSGRRYILFPFNDTTGEGKAKGEKRPIQSFRLNEFALINANFHSVNTEKEREFTVSKLNLSLKDLDLDQMPGRDMISNRQVDLSIGEITWRLNRDAIHVISIKDYSLKLDSLHLQNYRDTTMFQFANFTTGLKELDMQTGDSLFHLTMQSFKLSYRDKAITLRGISFEPNMSDAAMQRRFTWRNPVFSGKVGSVKLVDLNFDSLIYSNKIIVDEMGIDKASVTIFADQTKPVNPNRFPEYPGQQIRKIPIPLLIKNIRGTDLELINRERRPNGDFGLVHVRRMTLHGRNFTNLPTGELLSVNADAYIENKAHVKLGLGFSYQKPEFSMNVNVSSFNMPDLNTFIKSYLPATVRKGKLDDLNLNAVVSRTQSKGTMKFLYNDLLLDLDLKDQAQWKNDILTSVSNALMSSSNPPSPNKPPRIVEFKVDRDMNKGFINIMIKSLLAGFKETIIMSKENRKAYKEDKKLFRKKDRDK